MLEIDGVTKRYGRPGRRGRGTVVANDRIDLSVATGEVVGLLGHNGAGKSTLVQQTCGLVMPDSGRIRLDGVDVVRRPAVARRLCSLQPQSQVPLQGMTPRQAIEVVGRLRGASRRDARRRTEDLLSALDIGRWADVAGQKLSGGVVRLTGFCMAAVQPGLVVVLDEPTNDVDPLRRRLLWGRVRALADAGTAVLLVTHSVGEAERAVDRVVMLDSGRVVAAGTPSELTRRVAEGLRLEVAVVPGAELPPAPWRPDGRPRTSGRGRVSLAVGPDSAGAAVDWARHLVTQGIADEFALAPTSLEDAYLALAGQGHRDSTDATTATEDHGVVAA